MKPFTLIAFCGAMASGKDTYGRFYHEKFTKYPLVHYSFALPVKKELNKIVSLIKGSYSNKYISQELKTTEKNILLIRPRILRELKINRNLDFLVDRSLGIREILQFWGTKVRREENINYWVNIAKEDILKEVALGHFVYLTDARFKNECDLVKSLGGVLVYLDCPVEERVKRIIQRDNIVPDRHVLYHQSEVELKAYNNFDVVVDTREQMDIEKLILELKG